MANQAKYIDLTRTFLPLDPEAFPQSEHATSNEDAPEQRIPSMAYEGWNFMPTAQGYRSYFGLNASLDIDALPSTPDEVFVIQTNTYQNLIIALCNDGIYKKAGEVTGAWTQLFAVTPVTTSLIHYEWTYCVINNVLYIYRQGNDDVWIMSGEAILYTAPTELVTISLLTEQSGGTLAAATYDFRIAVMQNGVPGTASAVSSITVTGGSNKIKIDWVDPAANEGVRIYRMLTATTTMYVDVADGLQTYAWLDTSQGSAIAYPDPTTANEHDPYTMYEDTPTFLTMTGQIGIFKAGGRLGFWDSADAVAWSAYADKMDLTPSITTQANVTTFTKVLGKIVTIKQFGDGFIIYATKSIVRVKQKAGAVFQWESEVLLGQAGIAYPRQVAVGSPDTLHYAWTTNGLLQITEDKAELVASEIYDYLKESEDPIYLKMLEGRYLFLEIMESDFVYGHISTEINSIAYRGSGDLTYIQNEEIVSGERVATEENALQFLRRAEESVATNISGLSLINNGQNVPVEGGAYIGYELDGTGIAYGIISSLLTDEGVGVPINLTYAVDGFTLMNGTYPIYNASMVEQAYLPSTDGITENWLGLITSYASFPADAVPSTDGHAIRGNVNTVAPTTIVEMTTAGIDFAQLFVSAAAFWNKQINWLTQSINAWKRQLEEGSFSFSSTLNSNTSGLAYYSPADDAYYLDGALETFYEAIATNPLPLRLEKTIADFFIPIELSDEEYTIINGVVVMYKSITKIRRYRLKVFANAGNISGESVWGGSPVDGITMTEYGTLDAYLAAADAAAIAAGFPTYVPHYATANASTWSIRRAVNGFAMTSSVHKRFNFVSTVQYRLDAAEVIDVSRCAIKIAAAQMPLQRYDYTNGVYVLDGTYVPPVFTSLNISTLCSATSERSTFFSQAILPLLNQANSSLGDTVVTPSVAGTDITFDALATDPDFPALSSSFLLQDGSPAPINPTMNGAFVYDTQYKKWGKLKSQYKVLLDFSPINLETTPIVPYTKFGVQGACVNLLLDIKLFDANPTDSYIKYGKIGLSRLGMTRIEEILAQFRLVSTGTIEIQTSLDGKNVESGLTKTDTFTAVNQVRFTPRSNGRWHNIIFRGQFDLAYLQFNGNRSSRR